MQLLTKDGIRCDGCGLELKNDFLYHSIDFKVAKTKYSQHISLNELQYADIVETFDYCSKCIEKINDKVVQTNLNNANRKTGLRYCDFTNVDLMKQDTYLYSSITKVNVKHSGVPYTCDKCNAATNNPVSVCKCGNNKYSRHADVKTEPRSLELFLTDQILPQFVNRRKDLKAQGNDWNVTS